MTTYTHGMAVRAGKTGHAVVVPKQYDSRLIDQFHAYCVAVARTARQRDDATSQSRAVRCHLWVIAFAGGLICYYTLDRIFQLVALL